MRAVRYRTTICVSMVSHGVGRQGRLVLDIVTSAGTGDAWSCQSLFSLRNMVTGAYRGEQVDNEGENVEGEDERDDCSNAKH